MKTKKNKNLFLILKKEWYEKIAAGEKRIEYREYSRYWEKRLLCEREVVGYIKFKKQARMSPLPVRRVVRRAKEFGTVEFQCGYRHSRKYPRLKFHILKIELIKTPSIVKDTVRTEYCFAIYFFD
jgi:hypothetical protein